MRNQVRIISFVVAQGYLEGELTLGKKHILWRFEDGDTKIIPLSELTEEEYNAVIDALYTYIQVEPN